QRMIEKNGFATARLEQAINGARRQLCRAACVVTHRGSSPKGNLPMLARGVHQLVAVVAHRQETTIDGIASLRQKALTIGVVAYVAPHAAFTRAADVDPKIEEASRRP